MTLRVADALRETVARDPGWLDEIILGTVLRDRAFQAWSRLSTLAFLGTRRAADRSAERYCVVERPIHLVYVQHRPRRAGAAHPRYGNLHLGRAQQPR